MTRPISSTNQIPFTPSRISLPLPLFEIIEQWLKFENNPTEAQATLNRVKVEYGPAIDSSAYEAAQSMIDIYNKNVIRVIHDKSQRPPA